MITEIKTYKKISKTYYHGSKKLFNKFKLNNDITNPTYNMYNIDNNLGIFFTDNLTLAKQFANIIEFDGYKYVETGNKGYIYECKLNISKPFIIQEQLTNIDEDDPGQTYFNFIEELSEQDKIKLKKNYDSIIVYDMNTNYYEDGNYTMIVVFDPDDIEIINIF